MSAPITRLMAVIIVALLALAAALALNLNPSSPGPAVRPASHVVAFSPEGRRWV